MSTETQILEYAATVRQPSRSRILFVIFPYGAGLVVGGLLSLLMLSAAPDFMPYDWMWPFNVAMGSIIAGLVALAVVTAIAISSKKIRVARPWLVVTTIGAFVPPLATGLAMAANSIAVLTSPPPLVFCIGPFCLLAVDAMLIICAPLLSLDWKRSPTTQLQPWNSYLWLKRAATAAVIFALLFGVARQCAQWAFDRQCRQLATWIISNHPSPGTSLRLTMPASMLRLSQDQHVDAALTTDGRLVFILRTSLGFHHNWDGYLYSTGPIAPGEIGPDGWGRMQVRVPGLPYHYIARQRDSRHFIVGSDVD